ncbi:cobalamin synthesis protein/P47K family protein [Alcanivorax xiamenensis]|uniref:Cobalamin synthesis protein/P47K family protein n=1 Tax=Alcanivorax xiamenensis TaxID=1177156 RepID=A0ABQ6YA17_9GAMM|nr:GTP-binding protein [Alcanivorax xiamenensis]KAF0806665.1 cobalamin synthesis protein/P47K family protein [Alcanivorax xiamenensis]
MTPLPVVVLTGFLGSGKTTVLNHWLSGRDDLAVIINELGQVGIDQALVGEASAPVSLLAGGCVCCTVQGSLRTTLRNLFMARAAGDVPRFSTVLVETTGAADPFGVTSVLEQDPWLRRHFQLRSVITTVDARSGMAGLSRHPEVIEQVRAADVLLLTKADQVELEQRGPLEAALAELNSAAERQWSEQGRVEPALLDRAFPRRCRVTGQLSAVAGAASGARGGPPPAARRRPALARRGGLFRAAAIVGGPAGAVWPASGAAQGAGGGGQTGWALVGPRRGWPAIGGVAAAVVAWWR